jgi:competence transcription factor ComK
MNIEKTNFLEEIVSNLSGKITILVSPVATTNMLEFNSNTVVEFIWISPWTLDVFKKCTYIELDTRFHVLRP